MKISRNKSTGHYQVSEGGKVISQAGSLDDAMRQAGIEPEVPNTRKANARQAEGDLDDLRGLLGL